MSDEQFTRCPSCRTVFRVTQVQLELRAGQVRCGHCHTVFDGVAHLVSLAPPPAGAEDGNAFDEAALGPPTVTLRSARALEPAPDEAEAPDGASPPPAGAAAAADHLTRPVEPQAEGGIASRAKADVVDPAGAPIAADPADRAAGAAEHAPARQPRTRVILYGVALAGLLLLLAGQAAYHFRDALAARFPALAPVLTKACAAVGCAVGPPREIADLAIQASDLQADSAHKGLLVLTATIRNRSARTLAYPHVELSLTDAQDQVVVRRVFAPADYAGGTADLAGGIPANAEVSLKMFIDASATTQAGYRLYLFYL